MLVTAVKLCRLSLACVVICDVGSKIVCGLMNGFIVVGCCCVCCGDAGELDPVLLLLLLVVVDVQLELGVVELESETGALGPEIARGVCGRAFSGVGLRIRFCTWVGMSGVVSPEDGVGGAKRLGPGSSLLENLNDGRKIDRKLT